MKIKRKLISIIIPAYNEQESIRPLFDAISLVVSKIKGYSFEIIFIDDGSSDRTFSAMRGTSKKIAESLLARAFSLNKNYGKTTALRIGIEKAEGDYVVMMDADLQDDPAYIPKFIKKIEDDVLDLVVGNRTDRYKHNFIKNGSSRLVNKIMRRAFGYEISDMNCGYKIMRMDVAKDLNLKSDYHRFIPLLALMNGYRVGQIKLSQKKRIYGKSKYGKTGVLRGLKFLVDFLNLIFIYQFYENPFKLFGKSGVLLFLSGFGILIYLSVIWSMGASIGGRPLFLLGILLLILGVNVISLGLLGEIIVFKKSSNSRNLIKIEESD